MGRVQNLMKNSTYIVSSLFEPFPRLYFLIICTFHLLLKSELETLHLYDLLLRYMSPAQMLVVQSANVTMPVPYSKSEVDCHLVFSGEGPSCSHCSDDRKQSPPLIP